VETSHAGYAWSVLMDVNMTVKTEMLSLVGFQTPSSDANFILGLIQDDKGSSQKILAEMKTEAKDAICSSVSAEANCSVEISEKQLTHKNGYDMHVTTLLIKMSDEQMSLEIPTTFTRIPDGKNTWVMISMSFSPTDSKQLSKEITSISESFKIFNYKGEQKTSSTKPSTAQTTKPSTTQTTPTQKQLSLDVKAVQENDQLTITITNPKSSSSDVYGVKLTTTTGKIKNYIKVNGWDHKRISDNTVSYQTKSSPLGQSDVIKIKLKVDSKKPEIKWEALSKDQKSLGTGKVRP